MFIAPPTKVTILSSLPRLSNDIIVDGTSGFNLTCVTDNLVGFSYLWYHNGRAVSSGAGQTGLTASGNVMSVTQGVIGFVQCFATGAAGSASEIVYLSELQSTVILEI